MKLPPPPGAAGFFQLWGSPVPCITPPADGIEARLEDFLRSVPLYLVTVMVMVHGIMNLGAIRPVSKTGWAVPSTQSISQTYSGGMTCMYRTIEGGIEHKVFVRVMKCT
ncbi:hypothetical protein CC80DRAFT_501388 [Byssothecium circinans]|uniref:Uncharacterized protein n=1 Tax=Byssothecium circinans TaxID=147558 RepID=A0A6A5UG96_9PLEO|nr:hypothetical protein CC80DRAFT_501388 [Byssothecium circinans]